MYRVWLSDFQGNEQAPWASAPAGNQSLRLCLGKLHAEEDTDSDDPQQWNK